MLLKNYEIICKSKRTTSLHETDVNQIEKETKGAVLTVTYINMVSF